MAKNKRNPNTTKSLSTVQTTHSYSINSATDHMTSPLGTSPAVSAAPGEDVGVCIVCEDECTCGAAAAAASKATTKLSTSKKRLILKMPRAQGESLNKSRRQPRSSPITKFQGVAPTNQPPILTETLDMSATGLPTFVPASVFGSDSSLSSPSSESDDTSSSDGSLENDDTDTEIEAEEERLIVQETLAMQKLRARREQLENTRLGIDENSRRRWDKMNWNDRERHPSVGAGVALSDIDASTSSDADSGSSGDDEHDDGEGEDDNDDAELDASSVPGFEWSDYDDDFDADLFFANLSDSSFDSSSSDSEPEQTRHPAATGHSTDGSVSLQQVIGAAMLPFLDIHSSTPLPLVVTENWDGQLVFANGINDGEDIFDTAFLENATILPTDPDSMHEADEQEIQGTSSPDYGCERSSVPDGGETTDEDELHPELGPILFANSPFNQTSKAHHPHIRRSTSSFVNQRVQRRRRNKTHSTEGMLSRLTPALSTSSGSQISESHKLIPSMGSFTISGNLGLGITAAIIDGSRSEILPSPYPRPQRRKRRAIQHNDLTLRTPKRVRHSSDPRTPVVQSPVSLDPQAGIGNPETPTPDDVRGIPQQPPPAIDLRDVLHVTVLDDQPSDEHVNADDGFPSETKSVRNRWERIPINAFHRLRSSVRAHGGALGSPVTMGGPSSAFDLAPVSTSTSPRPADGFSYGATTSVVSPYSGFGAFGDRHSPRRIKRDNSVSERHSRRKFTLGNLAGEPHRGRPG